MIISMSDGGTMCPPPPRDRSAPRGHPAARPAVPTRLDAETPLARRIAIRQARLAALETMMIGACEAAVTGPSTRANTLACPAQWNRTNWRRYLAAAMRLEPVYGPRIRRLRREIGQLERLRALLTTH